MHKLKIISILLISFALLGCINPPKSSNTRKFIPVLGGEKGWYADTVSIVKDFTVSGLRIRVSTKSPPSNDCISNPSITIEINGPINKDTSFIIEKLMSEFPNCIHRNGGYVPHVVYMNSHGGTLDDGYAIGRVLRSYRAYTLISSGQVCASACAVSFLGGISRKIDDDGKIIFHAPYRKRNDILSLTDQIICADAKQADSLTKYYKEMLDTNLANKIFERTMDYCSRSDGWTLDSGAANFFGITNR